MNVGALKLGIEAVKLALAIFFDVEFVTGGWALALAGIFAEVAADPYDGVGGLASLRNEFDGSESVSTGPFSGETIACDPYSGKPSSAESFSRELCELCAAARVEANPFKPGGSAEAALERDTLEQDTLELMGTIAITASASGNRWRLGQHACIPLATIDGLRRRKGPNSKPL